MEVYDEKLRMLERNFDLKLETMGKNIGYAQEHIENEIKNLKIFCKDEIQLMLSKSKSLDVNFVNTVMLELERIRNSMDNFKRFNVSNENYSYPKPKTEFRQENGNSTQNPFVFQTNRASQNCSNNASFKGNSEKFTSERVRGDSKGRNSTRPDDGQPGIFSRKGKQG